MNDFSIWLNQEMNIRGMNNNELARKAKVSASNLSMILNDRSSPGYEFCAKIAKALDLPSEFVMHKAGLITHSPIREFEGDLTLRELYEAAKKLSPEEREDLLRYTLWRVRESRNK